ncbi:zinc finger HIT domain-containing protein 1-like [Gigantopelta aegis]|uniref:zinc finger HIT domain-containing protein 1-like n=1 Tax=Gigantopelta aegis TaxID=1735272 RepID=UPI001B88DD49|nr:zinc finger HIT domain-containing protein 1-like [Gigantopelta aegis]
MATPLSKRESGRIKNVEQKRILDEATRRRRQRKALEALEQDNFSEDPHADLKMSKKAPKFQEEMESNGPDRKKKRKSKGDFKPRFKKSFSALLEEEQMMNKDGPTYFTASVPPSTFPSRHFCAICGYLSNYTCVQCGTRYCCVKCLGTHQDTRCLKFIA